MQFQKLDNTCSLVHLNNMYRCYCDKKTIIAEYYKSKDFDFRHKYIVYFSNIYFNIFERIKRGFSLKGTYRGYNNNKVYIYFIKIDINK